MINNKGKNYDQMIKTQFFKGLNFLRLEIFYHIFQEMICAHPYHTMHIYLNFLITLFRFCESVY